MFDNLQCPPKKKYYTKFCPMKLGQNFVKYFGFLGNGVSIRNAFEIFWSLVAEAAYNGACTV